MADDVLRIERHERIAIVTLNRPDRLNALSVELREALIRACQELRDDDNVWAVILTGAGRGFCSGVDLRTPRADNESSPSRQERLDVYGWVGRQAMAVYRTLDKPIIAAVNGVAAGAGMSLALSCDMRVGSELTRFKTVFIERSLSPDSGLSFFLPRIVGYSRAWAHRNKLHTHTSCVCGEEDSRKKEWRLNSAGAQSPWIAYTLTRPGDVWLAA